MANALNVDIGDNMHKPVVKKATGPVMPAKKPVSGTKSVRPASPKATK